MVTFYHPLQRSERIIALGRVTLAGFSLLAIWLDPTAPAAHAETTYLLLSGYLLYALLFSLLTWILPAFFVDLRLATHVFDLAAFTAFLLLTEGPTSPLFAYFVFALLAAALRWRWRGVLWTALATLPIFLGLGAYAQWVLQDPAFELNRFVIRTVYLAVAAVLLGYLSAYEERLRQELARLAEWPWRAADGRAVKASLRHAAEVVGAPRTLAIWEEAEEPWRHLALYGADNFRSEREPSPMQPLVAEPLGGADFLCADAASPDPQVLHTSAQGLKRWHGPPVPAGLRQRFAIGSVLCLRLPSQMIGGHLLFLDKRGMTADDLVLGGIVARYVAADLEHAYLQRRLQQAAIAEERARLARDLHDGVLQSLAGLALQLKAVQRLLKSDPTAAAARLQDLSSLITSEQRDLRFFVRQLKPLPLWDIDVSAPLAGYLRELAERMERQWGLQVQLTLAPLPRPVPEPTAHAVYRVVQEALANAVRHGHASIVQVRVGVQDDRLDLVVADNGRGFAFHERLDLATLTLRQAGPRSLMERMGALGGDLVIDSTGAGARLEISLPLGGEHVESAGSAHHDEDSGGGR